MRIPSIINAVVKAHQSKRPLMIWGPPGVGKSAGVQAACKEIGRMCFKQGLINKGGKVLSYGEPPVDSEGNPLDVKDCIGFHDVRISQCDLVELGGLVYKTEIDTMGRLCPDWWPHVGRTDLPDFGIVFFDELTGGSRSVQGAAYQPMQERVLAGKRLKPGWVVIGAGNRITDGGVANPMPTPLANRMMHADAESHHPSWDDWAMSDKKANVPMVLIAFLRFRPELLNTFEDHVKNKKSGPAFATERTWHVVGDMENAGGITDSDLELLQGVVGKGPAVEFMAFKRVWQDMPDLDEILLNPEQAPMPEKSDAQFAVATALAQRATPDNMEAVVTYYGRFPNPELSVLGVKDVSRVNRSCLQTKAYAHWAKQHAELLQ